MNVGVSCQKIGSGRCSVVRMPSEIREEEGPKERVESMASNRIKVQQQSLSEREERQVTDDGRRKKTRSEEEGKCWAEADKMRKESLTTTFANDEMPQFRPESSGFSSTQSCDIRPSSPSCRGIALPGTIHPITARFFDQESGLAHQTDHQTWKHQLLPLWTLSWPAGRGLSAQEGFVAKSKHCDAIGEAAMRKRNVATF